MLLKHEYLNDVKDMIQRVPEDVFSRNGLNKENILANPAIVEGLWIQYQKGVEDYDLSVNESFCEALRDVLGLKESDCVIYSCPTREASNKGTLEATWKTQLSKDEASALYDSGWWKDKTPQEILDVQLFERRLIMPFCEFQKAVEDVLGENLATYAFADAGALQRMYTAAKAREVR